ncbi:polysaccharide biosynthesis tyrosine autokinase [Geomonas sp. RF6]|uniref:polysaccharide biosynthesis tyrosine autokinase n=1 Tax=Geomonas sp. RF6 TaxID=2897342 RepID=UPI001E621D30|nr:polysaccharide biosynthesis tyrosine autokinase [Geomonas sp. RF6]UFS68828.1 polysaccharide biosynthesis tyrosine autokinase [Geomonas sp. RF6]
MHVMKVVERKSEIRGADIGNILIDAGRLTVADLNRIVALQGKEEILFGEAAVALGILSEEDVRWALSCQYSYPSVDTEDRALARELIAAHDPADPRVEALRCVRSGLMFTGAGKRIKTIAIVSADAEEGKTFVAANLAVVFAQLGLRTLLMDLNFRTPRVHSLFQMKNNTGASSLIIKRALFEKAVHKTTINALAVLPSGPKPPNPSELLSWQDSRELMATVKENFDVAIIDTPAFVKTADAMMIASLCDGTLITALKGKTKLAAMAQMKKQLEASSVRILGSVMNEMGKKK